jgi:glycosyltransferase involved in cell wall biosynthesis
VMSVSTIEPRKNLKTLILAYADLPTIIKASMPLLIVGARGWGEMDLPKSLAGLEAEGSVRFAGYVSDRELRDLYAGARAMFYPSLYEGFGMPITEALACGTPVVTSQSSSMPDAGGSVSRYVAPLDIDGWRQEFKRTLASEDHLDVGARQDRLAHAQSFSWDEAADTVEAMYRSLL